MYQFLAGQWQSQVHSEWKLQALMTRDRLLLFGGTSTGDSPNMIDLQGENCKSLPSAVFPPDWHITFTNNHWANAKTVSDYLEKILFLPLHRKKEKGAQVLVASHPALVIFDRFRAQCTTSILETLESRHVHVAIVPANCTDRLQPLDVSVNKAAKDFFPRQFQAWYSEQVCHPLQQGSDVTV